MTGWKDNLDFRLRGSFPLKAGFTASAIYRNTRGADMSPTWAIPANAIANSAYGFRWKTVNTSGWAHDVDRGEDLNLVTPQSLFGDRFQQVDLSAE